MCYIQLYIIYIRYSMYYALLQQIAYIGVLSLDSGNVEHCDRMTDVL